MLALKCANPAKTSKNLGLSATRETPQMTCPKKRATFTETQWLLNSKPLAPNSAHLKTSQPNLGQRRDRKSKSRGKSMNRTCWNLKRRRLRKRRRGWKAFPSRIWRLSTGDLSRRKLGAKVEVWRRVFCSHAKSECRHSHDFNVVYWYLCFT